MGEIVPVVLAAGASRRMGYPKALLPLDGRRFLDCILDTLVGLGLPEPIVVLGGHADVIAPALAGRRVRIVPNPRYEAGQLSSIQVALAALDPEPSAVLLWPVDQPAVPAEVVGALLRRYREGRPALVLPVCGGRRGHPAVLDRSLFAELRTTPLDKGAKPVILAHSAETALVETTETGTVLDVDTPADYERLTGETLEAALRREG